MLQTSLLIALFISCCISISFALQWKLSNHLFSRRSSSSILRAEPHFRIGHGYDIHRLVEGKKLVIGGVYIPYATGAEAHSDGDAVYHRYVRI